VHFLCKWGQGLSQSEDASAGKQRRYADVIMQVKYVQGAVSADVVQMQPSERLWRSADAAVSAIMT
jgi:hypothetical protein